MENIVERINAYCKKHTNPPELKMTLFWNDSQGCRKEHTFFPDGLEHKNFYRKDGVRPVILRSCVNTVYAAVFNYDHETKLFEASIVSVSGLRPKQNDTRAWKYVFRSFIPEEEKAVYSVNGKRSGRCRYSWEDLNVESFTIIEHGKECSTCEEKVYLRSLVKLPFSNHNFKEAFVALIGNRKKISGGRYLNNYEQSWALPAWLAYTEKTKNATSKAYSNKIEYYNNMFNFTELTPLEKTYLAQNTRDSYWYEKAVSVAHMKGDVLAFRVFVLNEGNMEESKRVFLDFSKKKRVLTTINLNSEREWVPNGSFTEPSFSIPVVNLAEVVKNGSPKLKYLEKIVDFSKVRLYKFVYNARSLEIEQLINMGFLELANKLSSTSYKYTYYLGDVVKPSSTSLLKKYGINREILELGNENCKQDTPLNNYRCHPIDTLKKLLGYELLSSLDKEKLKILFKSVGTYWDWGWGRHDRYSNFRFETTGLEKANKIIHLYNLTHRTGTNHFKIYDDIIHLYDRIPAANREEFPKLKTEGEFRRYHDQLTVTVNELDRERQRLRSMAEAERYKELDKKAQKLKEQRIEQYEYKESDFEILVPQSVVEIAKEGSYLGHCVSSYTDRHALGHTTILFLRRTAKPNEPFYTIEVNGGTVVQIHGKYNNWLGNNPEAIPCVARWLRKTGLSCSDVILRSNGKGYGGHGGMLVPMPEI